MAAAEHAIAINDDISMELPTLPPNQGLEAFKDIVFGSVSYNHCAQPCGRGLD